MFRSAATRGIVKSTMNDAFGPYNATVEDHFRHPRNLGAMPNADLEACVSNPVCGDLMKLYLRVEGDEIVQASFQTQGCPAAIAASSVTTVLLTGRSREAARHLTNEEVERALGGLPRGKAHCSILAEEAITQALDRWDEHLPSGDRRSEGRDYRN